MAHVPEAVVREVYNNELELASEEVLVKWDVKEKPYNNLLATATHVQDVCRTMK